MVIIYFANIVSSLLFAFNFAYNVFDILKFLFLSKQIHQYFLLCHAFNCMHLFFFLGILYLLCHYSLFICFFFLFLFLSLFLSFEINFDVWCEAGIIFHFRILFKIQLFYLLHMGEMAFKRLKRQERNDLYTSYLVDPI